MQAKALLTPIVAALVLVTTTGADNSNGPQFQMLPNPTGMSATLSTNGAIDLSNPFFQSLGTNGRSCSSCHVAADGWTVTPATIQQKFAASDGTDPIFRLNDGANSPLADISTVEKRRLGICAR